MPVDNSADNWVHLLISPARSGPSARDRPTAPARGARLGALLTTAWMVAAGAALVLGSGCDRGRGDGGQDGKPTGAEVTAGGQAGTKADAKGEASAGAKADRRSGSGQAGAAPPIDPPVRRVVTTTPSSTEIVAAAGGVSRIVGIDRFSDYPPQVVGLPVVGDFMSPSVEAILQLRPDLVVLDKVQNRTAAALGQGGTRTLVLEMHTVEDVLAGLSSAGRALGSQREADAARAALERAIGEARARGRTRPRRVRTLMIVDRELGALRGLVAAGPGSYLDQLLAMVGGENVLSGSRTRYPNIAPETIIEARPDVILDAVHTDDPAAAARDWQTLGARVPAVANGRVHLLAETYYKSPGPRLALALHGLEALLWRDAHR